MTIKHNQKIESNHFRKDWQRRVRVHFDQPARKLRRRNARAAKAASCAPRPVDKLRPIVRCPTLKYNRRVRAGRGFSLAELKEAGIARKLAPTIGISVDSRRQNLSTESLAINVARLKAYSARLILFPRKSGQHKNGDTSAAELKKLDRENDVVKHLGGALPITNKVLVKEIKKGDMPDKDEGGAYRRLRMARSDARLAGVREQRSKKKDDDAAGPKK